MLRRTRQLCILRNYHSSSSLCSRIKLFPFLHANRIDVFKWPWYLWIIPRTWIRSGPDYADWLAVAGGRDSWLDIVRGTNNCNKFIKNYLNSNKQYLKRNLMDSWYRRNVAAFQYIITTRLTGGGPTHGWCSKFPSPAYLNYQRVIYLFQSHWDQVRPEGSRTCIFWLA